MSTLAVSEPYCTGAGDSCHDVLDLFIACSIHSSLRAEGL